MKKNIITEYIDFVQKLNETSVAPSNFPVSGPFDMDALLKANDKIRRAVVWLNIKKGFYAQLLPHLNIYGSFELDPPTMATDGKSIIFDPNFVLNQTDAAVRFVICHEVLHCVNGHHKRRGKRHPIIWNWACDYAINPILGSPEGPEDGFEYPRENGEIVGLYDKKYEGMTAEDIYDLLLEDEMSPPPPPPPRRRKGPVTPPDDPRRKRVGRIYQPGENPPKPKGPVVQQGENDEDELPEVGQKVKLIDGGDGVIKKVHPNGDIEI
jgi:hypothetical protein